MDDTEEIRRAMLSNFQVGSREALEERYGRVWNTSELSTEFEVEAFLAPIVVVKRKADGQQGSLQFQANPRFYFSFQSE